MTDKSDQKNQTVSADLALDIAMIAAGILIGIAALVVFILT